MRTIAAYMRPDQPSPHSTWKHSIIAQPNESNRMEMEMSANDDASSSSSTRPAASSRATSSSARPPSNVAPKSCMPSSAATNRNSSSKRCQTIQQAVADRIDKCCGSKRSTARTSNSSICSGDSIGMLILRIPHLREPTSSG